MYKHVVYDDDDDDDDDIIVHMTKNVNPRFKKMSKSFNLYKS